MRKSWNLVGGSDYLQVYVHAISYTTLWVTDPHSVLHWKLQDSISVMLLLGRVEFKNKTDYTLQITRKKLLV
jgi:hypothetical protein